MTLIEFQDLLQQHLITVGYFSTESCNVCKVLRPQVRQICQKFNDVHFEYVDIEKAPELRGQYLVFSVPTIIIFVDGREHKRLNRYMSLQDFEAELSRLIEILAE
ncbi:MAG: thioredoxin family protein [Caldisericaceae bacterium]|nr:thioredoxin family protein [Caldisericaceae bacterium]